MVTEKAVVTEHWEQYLQNFTPKTFISHPVECRVAMVAAAVDNVMLLY